MSTPSSSSDLQKERDNVQREEAHVETEHQRRWRKTYSFLGFNKGYNFPLFIIMAGAMFGFCLARTPYLNITKFSESASPGEWYWYRQGHYRIGIIMHLASVIPGGLLLVLQFVPIIRHKVLLFHRINGYTVILLLLIGVASALMICRRSFGGHLSTQTAVGMLAIIVTGSIGMAYYNIKRLQIDQHRAWMLRVGIYCGSVVTVRLIQILCAKILPLTGDYYQAFSCDEIAFMDAGKDYQSLYPQCFIPNAAVNGTIPVMATWAKGAVEIGTALQISFGPALWMAIFLHAIGVEIYLKMTPAESERLRMVSYERQSEAGYKHPGSAGLTIDRWGDAPAWRPS